MYNAKNYSKESLINHGRSNQLNEAWYDYVPDVLKSGVKKLIGADNYEAAKKMLIDSPENTKKAEAAVDKLIKKKEATSPKATKVPRKTSNNLSVGSKGTKVKALQVKLGIKDDGDFGPGTKAAVIKFQKENGLTGDGIVGPKTNAALNNPKAKKKKETAKPAAKTPDEIAKAENEAKAKADIKNKKAKATSADKTADAENAAKDKIDIKNKKAAPKKKKTYDELKAEAKLAKKSERSERREGRKTKRSTRRNRRDIAKNKKKQDELKDELAELAKEEENFASLGESKVLNYSEFIRING